MKEEKSEKEKEKFEIPKHIVPPCKEIEQKDIDEKEKRDVRRSGGMAGTGKPPN